MFCGKLTRERNAFDDRMVRHQACRDEEVRKARLQKAEREKIDLIKRAIREVQSETPNVAVSHGDRERQPNNTEIDQ